MAKFDIVMPKMGESIIEATITRWLKSVGDMIAEDEVICEIATDKVDSEIPSPVEGKLVQLLYKEGDVVPVGKLIAVIDMDGENAVVETTASAEDTVSATAVTDTPIAATQNIATAVTQSDRFYSPLVKSIAKEENISVEELESISGKGKDGRVTKEDIMAYLANRKSKPTASASQTSAPVAKPSSPTAPAVAPQAPIVTSATGDTVVEMDRMRKLIADHMVMSTHVSPHVTMFHEVDMNKIVNWRNKMKDGLLKREGEKLTFTPIFVEAAAKALKEFPGVNASVNGYSIILRKNVNIGMAAALPSGNLIVPVIKNADQKNLLGLTKTVNDLADRSRNNKLSPDDIQDGTFTITNFGQFGSLTGTPIINQPQVAIMGLGTIHKQPVVIETPEGDVIAIRQRMILSLSFDHRVVDGALGGKFLRRVAELLENFDDTQTI
ncbi:MAG: 2-oxo acid dehydrogenase subunit E2 [Bacteroidetes bacterium]|nr:2-oxo acid dehydrogenase subunit E2 [Bacteroidota bacterium]